MKFIHIADMHFDTAFKFLSSRSNLGQVRRLDQRLIFSNIIDIIKKENIGYLFISGDLYEQKTIRESTIDFINSKFKEIPNTQIFISPGNHDPFIINSFYNTYNWANNVKIFGKNIEKIETHDANIYGFGFTDYECNCNLNLQLSHDKPNIFVMHASLDGQDIYNPVTTVALRSLGFDYIALGHIHKTNFGQGRNIIYPGAPISMGFDELGEHGIIKGELSNGLYLEFIKTDNRQFVEKYVDITNLDSVESLVEHINSMRVPDNEIWKVILVGYKHFDIIPNLYELLEENIIKVKDQTSIDYDLEKLSKEVSLKGLFVRNLLNKLNDENYNKEEVENAIDIGLKMF